MHHAASSLLLVFEEELQVDFEDRLEQAHVGPLVQTDLVLPDIDEQDLAGGQGEKSALPLKVLVLSALAAVSALDVHNEDVVGHLGASAVDTLVLRHPDTLRGLLTLRFGHDAELGAEEVVEERRLARRLRAKDGNEMVVEAGLGNMLELEVSIQVGAMANVVSGGRPKRGREKGGGGRRGDMIWGMNILELLLLVYHLNSMLKVSGLWLIANPGKVAVHRDRRIRGCKSGDLLPKV